MTWDEFKPLLSGLGPETALGRIIEIRSEESKDTLKYFSAEQHRIRNEWQEKERARKAKFNKQNKMKRSDPYAGLSEMFKGLLSK